jgi:hypothetical protein
MSNYAVIKNGIVNNIVVADAKWADAQTETVVEYTTANPAHMGGEYVDGFFYAPKPFASWVRSSGTWVAPTIMPTSIEENKAWVWNEATVSWINIDVDPSESFID